MTRPPICKYVDSYADMCGLPSAHFYLYEMERGGKNTFSRCDAHGLRAMGNPSFEKISLEEFMVFQVLDS